MYGEKPNFSLVLTVHTDLGAWKGDDPAHQDYCVFSLIKTMQGIFVRFPLFSLSRRDSVTIAWQISASERGWGSEVRESPF